MGIEWEDVRRKVKIWPDKIVPCTACYGHVKPNHCKFCNNLGKTKQHFYLAMNKDETFYGFQYKDGLNIYN